MTNVGHSAAARRKEDPLAVPVTAVVVNVTVADQIAALPTHTCGYGPDFAA